MRYLDLDLHSHDALKEELRLLAFCAVRILSEPFRDSLKRNFDVPPSLFLTGLVGSTAYDFEDGAPLAVLRDLEDNLHESCASLCVAIISRRLGGRSSGGRSNSGRCGGSGLRLKESV